MKYQRIRVREELFGVMHFMKWKLSKIKTRDEMKYIEDEIIKESLKNIKEMTPKISTNEYGKERELIGITLSKNTIDMLKELKNQTNLYIGELVELCAYIYCVKHFSKNEIEENEIQKWGINVQWSEK